MQNPSQNLFEHHHIVVDPNQTPTRIDVFLVGHIASLTRTRLQVGMEQKYVHVNGKSVKASYKVKPGDVIRVFLPKPPQNHTLVPEEMPLDIIYEDNDILIINKPAELVVHPGISHWTGTLANGLVYYLNNLPYQEGNEARPGLLHRLDKGTSGLIIVAKTAEVLQGLSKQFVHHTIQRTYYLLVWGDVKKDEGTIDQPIKRSVSDRKKMVVSQDEKEGKNAVTHYRVVERFGYVTLLQCTLETGRTHQIRVHMAYIGHPLFGDPLYGGNRVVKGQQFSKYKAFIQNCFALLPYQALHAKKLSFFHPVQKRQMEVEAPLPLSFDTLLNKWRKYIKNHVM